jgi:signal transduction histidine kinase/CheY-like chemotaxis protein
MALESKRGFRAAFVIALAALGFAADLFPLSMFLGEKVYLGSFFGFIAFLFAGTWPGTAVLAIASSAAALRGDPGFFVVALAEALYVFIFYRGRRRNLANIDGMFWCVAGFWIAFAARRLSGLPAPESFLAAAIFASHGIGDAAVASLLGDYVRYAKPRALESLGLGAAEEVPFRRVVFESSLVLALAPILILMNITSQSRTAGLAMEIENRLEAAYKAYALVAGIWREDKASEFGPIAFAAEAAASGRPQILALRQAGDGSGAQEPVSIIEPDSLARILSSIAPPLGAEATIIDPRGRVVASSAGVPPSLERLALSPGYMPISTVSRSRLIKAVRDTYNPGFFLEKDAGLGEGWRVIFLLTIEPFRFQVILTGLTIALFALFIVMATLPASAFASKILVASLEKLRCAAERFAEGGEAIAWPASNIREIASLSRTFGLTSGLLDRRYHETLTALDVASRANHAKEQLLAAVSHDIRGPLGGIVDMASLLGKEMLGPETRERVLLIEETGRSLCDLVEELLDRTAIEAGQLRLHLGSFDLHLLFEAVERAYRSSSESKGIALSFDWDESLPRQVVGDRGHLFQALGNLVGNAVKYTERGSVEVSARLIGLDESGTAAELRFDVTDTGPGIPADKLDRLFDPFYRVQKSASEAIGRGLGLAIAKKVIALMGGEIGVESEPGHGSRFHFTVGLALEPPHTAALAGQAGLGAKARVLLADDTRISREVTKRVLEDGGHAVTAVEDGRAAVDAALGSNFDLILLDLDMPCLSGMAAAKEIRSRYDAERPEVPYPRIIALTASLGDEEKLRIEGFDDCIVKPASPELLLEAAELARRWSAQSGAAGSGAEPDFEGIIASYGGDRAFTRRLLGVFVDDGGAYLSRLRASVAKGERRDILSTLHSLINVMGAGRANGPLMRLRACEALFRGAVTAEPDRILGVSEAEETAIEAALTESERAIAAARAYLEGERAGR